jgi:hypothetical protein
MKSIRLSPLLLLVLLLGSTALQADLDIPVMTWTPRSDWLNVKSAPFNAVGDGKADDSDAIQAALTAAGIEKGVGLKRTVYLPPGTYRITKTLDWQGTNVWKRGIGGAALIGCGRNTIIKWDGPSGAAMFWTKGATTSRYIGIAWDGDNKASCAYEASSPTMYEFSIRHENESFRNFTVPGTYLPGGEIVPAGAIVAGLSLEHNSPDAEVMIWNCLFVNCSNAINVGYEQANNYLWEIKGCEFENCGVGILNNMGKFLAVDCHFQNSTQYDISTHSSMSPRVRRCTSTGSNAFFASPPGANTASHLFQDCRIDGWTSNLGAIQSGGVGPTEVLDCVFSNPPQGRTAPENPHNSPIVLTNPEKFPACITVSNNSCPTIAPENLVNLGPSPAERMVTIPPGKVPPMISTGPATLTFLHPAQQDDRTKILDVTQAPYNADNSGKTDVTAILQQAIDDAKAARNGSVVYLPYGLYMVSKTLEMTGANYVIQGSGSGTQLVWNGEDGGTFINVTTPQKLSLEQIQFIYNIHKFKDVAAINQTSAGPSEMNYDGLYYDLNGASGGHNYNGTGLRLVSLPAGSRVTCNYLQLPLTFHDCGPAQILITYSVGGRIIIDGATQPKTGFLGIINGENGTPVAGPDSWNITVNDNQNFVIGDYYQEQGHNCILLQGGAGKEPGYVTIGGIKHQYFNEPDLYITVKIENYSGRFYYGQVNFANKSPTKIVQTGTNPCDIILDSIPCYNGGGPTFSLDKGANLIQLNNFVAPIYPPLPGASQASTFIPNVQPEGWGDATARALDDERRLGALDLDWNYGMPGLTVNQ